MTLEQMRCTMTPLLDYDVPAMPRAMSQTEWRKSGYTPKSVAKKNPLRREWREQARRYRKDGETEKRWHSGMVNIYTREQVERTEDVIARRRERERVRIANEQEWRSLGVLSYLHEKARCIYAFLRKQDRNPVVTSNGELQAECKIRRNDVKRHRDALVDSGLVEHRLTTGKKSLFSLLRL